MKNSATIIYLLMLTTLAGCSSLDNNENHPQAMEMRINHYRSTGFGVGPVLTYLVQQGNEIGSDNWNKFYPYINGFNYEPGYMYILSVIKEPIDNPPPDGSSYSYTLNQIISKEKVDDEVLFDIYLKMNEQSFLTLNSSPEYTILDQIEINCNELCAELNELIQNKSSVIGTFRHISGNKIELVGLE
ncbi:MAG TPA: DUF4377 domain-containing protein [Salinimicrobium sp.]|nr:DUF4377 domain-containing protein [Salinimicrobium sp.]